MTPTSDQVRGQLDRLLASSVFANAGRMSRFLKFVVEQALAGDGERLKEYVIGVEVFDRDANYDPRVDAIVRVEAARLRSKLAEYYAGAGRADAVLLTLPKGGYAPLMKLHGHAAGANGIATNGTSLPADFEPAPEQTASIPLSVLRRRRWLPGAALAAGVAAMVAAWGPWSDLATVDSQPRIAVLPFVAYASDTANAEAVAMRVTEGVTTELVRAGGFPVVSSSAARAVYASSARPREIAAELDASVLIEARVTVSGERVSVETRATSAAEQKLWVQSFAGNVADIDSLEREIVAAILGDPLVAAKVVPRD